MKILYLDPDLNNLLDIAYNPGLSNDVFYVIACNYCESDACHSILFWFTVATSSLESCAFLVH